MSFAAACGGGKHGQSVCDNQVPAPPACMTQCDPMPGAANACPAGYHCAPDGFCDALCTTGGNECGDGYHCTTDGQCVGDDSCTGLECQIVDCTGMSMPDTTISGTVYAPNGTLPLYGVTVYVPNSDPGPLPDGAQCSRCGDMLPGNPVVQTTTDEAGHFTLSGVPAGANIPLVIQSGKWRRQITVANVGQCQDNALQADQTRLPRDKSEGDIPKIALTTGNADSLECLIRKLGVADSEITNSSGTGRVNFYDGNGVSKFDANWAGGGGQTFSSAANFWNDVNNLKPYDIVILSCEGAQNPGTKPQAALDAMKAYADLGGRVFMSHWHNIWIEGSTEGGGNQAPAVWPQIAQWSNGGNTPDPITDTIDEVSNPKGPAFATWMLNVMGSTTRDQITVHEGRTTCTTVDNSKAERWTYWQNGNNQETQNFQFTTPNEADPGARCGKVVFSDMHVSGSIDTSKSYPTSCGNSTDLTPQEKALAFMLFDLSSCVGQIGRQQPQQSVNASSLSAARL
jgi:hypothetical protein